ncbi:MAG: Ig-like domain repeat protein, partial [Acidobacteria bacterium]|nr:Ig-like domain repeat protein [Acidobacteriota bacterium]
MQRSASTKITRVGPLRYIETSSLPSFEWRAASLAAPAAFFAPNITATKAAVLAAGGDLGAIGFVNPGDTLTYSVTVSNGAGAMDATGLSFSDTLNANLTLVGGSVMASPVAVDDSYPCTGNLSISISAGSGVLADDYLGLNPLATITASDTTSTNGGTVAVAGDGSFTYEPAAGFTGTDTFHYTLTNSTGSSTGTVSIIVSNRIWFINNTGGACASSCNGRFSHPFISLSAFISAAVDASGDRIFIYQGASSYAGALTLKTNERLIGQGDALDSTTLGFTPAANGPTLPSATAKPTLTNTLTLANGVTVLAISMSTGASTGITGSGGLTGLTVGDSPTTATNGITVTTTTGTTVSLNNVGGTFTFRSLSANGATTGLALTSTPASLNFTVTGDNSGLANGSGGTIQNITGGVIGNAPAYFLTASGNVTLKSMNMAITVNAFSGMLVDNNAGGTITVNITGCTFTGVGTGNATQNKALLQFEGGNTGASAANVTANVQNSFFFDNRTYGFVATAAGDSIMNATLNQSGFGTEVNTGAPVNNPGTTITNPPPFSVLVSNGSNAKVDYTITNNTFWGADGLKGAIYAVTISGASTVASSHLNGSFTGNKIGKAGALSSGCANSCAGLGLLPGVAGAFNPTVMSNDIRQVNSVGINFVNTVGGGATFTSSVKIKNNTLTEPDTTGSPALQRAIVVSPGNSGGANTSVCAEIGGPSAGEPNIISGAWQASNFIRVTNNNNSTTLKLPGYGGTALDTTAVNAFVSGNNGGASCNSAAGTVGFVGGGACPLFLAFGGVSPLSDPLSLFSMFSAAHWTVTDYASVDPVPFTTNPAYRPSVTAPSIAAPVSSVTTSLSQPQLEAAVAAVIARWSAAGLTREQLAFLRGIKFQIIDLPGAYLSEAEGNRILVDRDAGGNGWFIGATALDEAGFAHAASATRRYTDPSGAPAGRIDLLTAILHETGHCLGLDDSYAQPDRDNLMYGYLTVGERRLPLKDQARYAKPGDHRGTHFLSTPPATAAPNAAMSGETVNVSVGTLPAGKSVIIKFNATIAADFAGTATTNQASISGSNFSTVLSNNLSTPVIQPPTIAKSFSPTSIALSGTNQTTSTLSLTLINPNPSQALSAIAFTDTLTGGLQVDATPALANGCGGIFTPALAGGQTALSFSGGSLTAGGNCNISFKVSSTSTGAKTNATSGPTSTQANAGVASNTATLNVLTAPSFTKNFGAASVVLNGTTSLTFNLTNNDATFGLTGVSFTDTLPAGLTVATAGPTAACGGTYSTTAPSTIALTGGALAASGTCSFSVTVTGTTAGTKNNSVALTTTETGTNSTTATSSLDVFGPPTISKAFVTNPIVTGQTSVLNITVTNPASNPGTLTGLSFTDTLPAGLTAPNSSTASCNGTLAVSANVITLTGGSLASGANCVNAVTVTGALASGVAYTNTISSVSSTNGGTNNTPATANITVNKANTSLGSITDSPDPSVTGQPYTVGFVLSVTAPGMATPTAPTGSVTISDGMGGMCIATLPATSCPLTSTTAGSKTLTLTYSGDGNFNTSNTTAGHLVNKADTTTTIDSDLPDPSSPGQSVTVNFTVAPVAPGTGTPGGNVVVTVSGGAETCTGTVASGTCNITLTTPGNRILTATYAGDTNFNGSSDTEAHTVASPPTVTKSFAPAQIKVGETSVMTFSVANPNAALNLTNISFSDTFPAGLEVDNPVVSTNTCGGSFSPALAGGATSFSYIGGSIAGGGPACTITIQVKATTAGLKPNTTGPVTAAETGGSATSNTATLTVVGAPVLTKAFTPPTVVVGQTSSLGFTITNNNTTVALSGIGFTDTLPAGMTVGNSGPTPACNGGSLTTTAPNMISFTGGTLAVSPATCTFSVTVTATQPGSLVNTTGTISATESAVGGTATATLTVNKADTTTMVVSSVNPSVFGQAVTFTATVMAVPPGMGIPTGNVNFVIDGGAPTPVALNGSGQAALTTSALTVAGSPHSVMASYQGSTNFNPSSNTLAGGQVVNKASTTLTNITDSPDPSVTGQGYTVGFMLNVTLPGTGTPGGTVSVNDGTGGTCLATLPATSCLLTSTSAGIKTLTITYSGDGNFNGSNTTAGHQVNAADTTTTVSSSQNPSVFGQPVTFTATVAPVSPGGGTPTGSVTFIIDGVSQAPVALNGSGQATFMTSALTVAGSPHTVSATYGATTNYNASTGVLAGGQVVNQASTTTTIVSDNPDSSAVGQNVTVVFTVVATAPGAGTPTGNVVVTISGGAETCTGTVAAGSCVITLTTPGSRTLTATYAGDTNFNGGNDTEPHTVVAPPSIAKAFTPPSTPINGTSTLTITITNPAANTVALTGVGFTDNFPAGLVVANPLTFTNGCGGSLTDNTNGALNAGDVGIKLTGGTVNTGSTCTITINVTPTVAGPFVNTTTAVTSTNGGTGNTATA